MFKIGDFSQMGQVSIRMLRHYDELGLLKPAQIDNFTGYRYYTVEQLPRLNRILALKDMGLSLEQIVHLLDEDLPADRLRGMLMLKQAEIEQQIQAEQTKLARVEARLKQIEQEGKVSPYEIVLKRIEPMTIFSTRTIVPTAEIMPYYCHSLYTDIYGCLREYQLKALAEVTFYYNHEYTDVDIDMEASAVIDPGAVALLPPAAQAQIRHVPAVPKMASVIYEGCFGDIGQAITALFTWIGANQYEICGQARELHHFGSVLDEGYDPGGSLVIEMQVPVKKVVSAES